MRSFELRESPLRADHMTTKPLPSPREHTCTLRRFHSKNHTGTHVYYGQTRKRISAPIHQFGFAAALLLCRIRCNPSTLALQASLQTEYLLPRAARTSPWARGTACQQKCRPRTQGWLLRQAVMNEAHGRRRRLFYFFIFVGGDSNYTCSFTDVLDLKSLGSQRWLTSYLKGFFITITDGIHVPVCRVSVSAPTPAAVRILSVTTFASPPS